MKPGADALCKGLRYEPKSKDSGRWVRRFKTQTGKMKQYTFATYPETSLNDARIYVDSVRGQDCPAIRQLGEPTIGILIDRYIDEYIKAQRTPAAAASVRSALIRTLKPISRMKLHEVTAAILNELILTVKKRAPTMARLLRSELKQAWSYALSIGMTNTPCPITSLTGGRFKTVQRDRILNDDEVKQLMANLGQYSDHLQDIIKICLYTGMRSGEVVGLQSNWFETIDGVLWVTIPGELMKNKQAHRVPLFSSARYVAVKRINKGPLFPAKRDKSKALKQVDLAREVYNVSGSKDGWHLHDLRRTTRTNLQRIGCPFEISETILAHKLPGVSSVYARFQYTDEKIDWLKKLADYYDKLR